MSIALVWACGAGTASARQPSAPVTIEEVGTVAAVLRPFKDVDVDIPVELRGTTDAAVTVKVPVLLSLKRDTGAGAVTIRTAVEVLRNDKPVTGVVQLAAYERATFVVRLKGLSTAGTYSAQIVTGTATGAEVKTAVSVKVRSSTAIAAGLILLGVVLSGILKYLVGAYRDSLRTRSRLGLLTLRLRQVRDSLGDLDEQHRRVVDSVADQLEELRIRQTADDRPTAAQLDECGRKIPGVRAYVLCDRRIPPAADQALRNKLVEVKEWLDTPVDASDIKSRREGAEIALTDLAKAANALASPLARQITETRATADRELAAAEQAGEAEKIAGFTTAQQKLDDALRLVVSDQVAARKHLDDALAICRQHGGLAGPMAQVDQPAPPVEDDVVVDVSDPLRGLGTESRRADLVVTALVAVVAVLLGLQLLYVNYLAWGSSLDKITAFLWGLGLHPVGGVVFSGLDGLRERISSGQPQQ
ncbi:hypothetical protein [Saccharothrix carnea]|uniref:hypothetical protein n=1 Tax=Saccharothrix carnea TaxID=1280637 RepID=UPI0011B24101|nr:hypothetical protein [Saccharothrix carnea]